MGYPWARLDANIAQHDKIVWLKHQRGGWKAISVYVFALGWSVGHGTDGHIRATRGENFRLVGGSHETHQSMQEKCIKFNEKLKARGQRLEELRRHEFFELAAECEMNVVKPPKEGE